MVTDCARRLLTHAIVRPKRVKSTKHPALIAVGNRSICATKCCQETQERAVSEHLRKDKKKYVPIRTSMHIQIMQAAPPDAIIKYSSTDS